MYDVIVVGAGPAGSAAARYCAESGLRTLIIEEHASIGYPVQCAGLLSTNAFSECHVSNDSVIQVVRGATLHSSLGCELNFDAGETKAFVVDRGVLDREMAGNAVSAGADISLKTYAYDIRDNVLFTKGVHGHREIPFRLIIAADGPRSPIRTIRGMKPPLRFYSGVQAEVPYETDSSYVHLYPDASPDFFGWAIPAGDGRMRVGLAGGNDVQKRFSSFVRKFGDSCIHQVTGTIPMGVMPQTYGERTLFVGDAAGFAKPTSGGGVYTGVRSSRHAADVAALSCEEECFEDSILSAYESAWTADFGRELDFGYRFLDMRQNISPGDINDICQALNTPDMKRLIVEFGDMDRPTELMLRLLKNPTVFRMARKVAKSELRGLLFGNKR
ncbi:geranylgeranyl reductase family protein [Methanogenium organophilum]|uniref:NAD(P)/FAD-dependent oxidoreductase n=1 Tax=Methanogenium organophilum TaxID=2199 RepID=A0A9X9S3I6_METOG|nr:NAD(P)/FAD-dependent oxidoreductase [Methanogenium organophilum]WAI01249.1 NAD(P)/FAD-dependent oxidoreductase [Methanogenium organophilum]